ncbi:hypothetical protein EVAR_51925_1 [Eumeta japonica]|uniref:Uncharacterized protein n=1 Tax=Eumeta variegata TaxID=151549 RepID=A0A4C1XK48_EUMVA|nr:hypothetical protein EVAR_51925_1 [Eumeta japonica]
MPRPIHHHHHFRPNLQPVEKTERDKFSYIKGSVCEECRCCSGLGVMGLYNQLVSVQPLTRNYSQDSPAQLRPSLTRRFLVHFGLLDEKKTFSIVKCLFASCPHSVHPQIEKMAHAHFVWPKYSSRVSDSDGSFRFDVNATSDSVPTIVSDSDFGSDFDSVTHSWCRSVTV